MHIGQLGELRREDKRWRSWLNKIQEGIQRAQDGNLVLQLLHLYLKGPCSWAVEGLREHQKVLFVGRDFVGRDFVGHHGAVSCLEGFSIPGERQGRVYVDLGVAESPVSSLCSFQLLEQVKVKKLVEVLLQSNQTGLELGSPPP